MTDPTPAPHGPRVDIVVPLYNEEDAITAFHQQLVGVINSHPYDFQIFYVNDGSKDNTSEVLQGICDRDARITVIELSRNFGHQSALTAGMDVANGDFVITMDGDGQHPPELIPEMLKVAEAGSDIVLTQRVGQKSLSPFKRWTSRIFYSLTNRIGDTQVIPGGADFRLLSRSAVQSLRELPEYHRSCAVWSPGWGTLPPSCPSHHLIGWGEYPSIP